MFCHMLQIQWCVVQMQDDPLMMSSHVRCDTHGCHWLVETIMVKMRVLAVILWGIFITTLFWTARLSDNLEVNHLWLSLQVIQKTVIEGVSHSKQRELREPSFPLIWEPLARVADIWQRKDDNLADANPLPYKSLLVLCLRPHLFPAVLGWPRDSGRSWISCLHNQ